MKYVVFGEQEGLEELISEEEIQVLYAAKYIPLTVISTEYSLEEVQEVLPLYEVREEYEREAQE